MKTLLKVFVLAIVLALGMGEAFGQIVWTKDARNPVLSGGAIGAWNRNVAWPCVLFNTDSARYEMWFCASSGSPWRPFSVGFASSKDAINWTMYPSAVLTPSPGAWDAFTVEKPMVIRENGQYKMWYSSWYNNPPTYPGYLGYATSPDGVHWTKYAGNPVMGPGKATWEVGGPWGSAIMPFPGGYRMWYAGFDASANNAGLGYATSSDGITWQPDTLDNPVLKKGAPGQWDNSYVLNPCVLNIGGTYYVCYSGATDNGISNMGFATSKDTGITWTKSANNPVLLPSSGTWDATGVDPGTVLQRGDTLDLWYVGWDNSGVVRIGHARSMVGQAYAHDIAIDRPYARPHLDSTAVTARLTNPLNHAVALSAIVTDAGGVFRDSLPLYNDGMHRDGQAGDSIWGGPIPPPPDEGVFKVSLRTDDISQGAYQRLGDAVQFTTAGPVKCLGDTAYSTPQWGRIVLFRLKVSNKGSTAVTPAVGGTIRSLDTAATIFSGNPFTVGDITPGQVRISSAITMTFSRWAAGTKNIPFELQFSFNTFACWMDTLVVRVENPTGVALGQEEIPTTYELGQNYPNPFNPNSDIRYQIPEFRHVRLAVYDLLGREVAVLVNEKQAPGSYEVKFDGMGFSSGVYWYRLTAGQYVECRKMVLMK